MIRKKYHVSSLIQDDVFSSRKKGCIRCISSQVIRWLFIMVSTVCNKKNSTSFYGQKKNIFLYNLFDYYIPIKLIHLLNCVFSGYLIQKSRSTNCGFLNPYHYPLK